MTSKIHILLMSMLVFGLSATCTDKTLPDFVDVENEVLMEMAKEGIPSISACIIKDSSIIWRLNLGFADQENNLKADSITHFTLMSVSKLFLATIAMQLEEEEKLNLYKDINTYLPFEVRNPNYPDTKITSKMLLTHTSSLAWPINGEGIPDFYHFYPEDSAPLLKDWLPEYIIPGGTYYRDIVWKDFQPGREELYSNIGTALLGLVIENIVGEDYRDYCENKLLEPLKMSNSSFWFEDMTNLSLAKPYFKDGSAMEQYTLRHYPAANLKSNIEELSHFVIAYLNEGVYDGQTILDRYAINSLLYPQNYTSGLGNIWWNCLGDCVGHDGGGDGFSTRLEIHPGSNTGMIILSNKYNESVYPGGRIYELIKWQVEQLK